MNLIELEKISKSFRDGSTSKKVLEEVSLTVKQGEFVVLQGANGSGKTTLINIILGLMKPKGGNVKLFGLSPLKSESKIPVGVVLQKVTVPKNLKVKELVHLLRSYYPSPLSTEEVLNAVNLDGKHDFWASKLSGGEEQRLYFALALTGNPELLIMDEPTRNLDQDGCSEFWTQVHNCVDRGKTILMVTNNQSDWKELDSLATRIITLREGRIDEDKIIEPQQVKANRENEAFSAVKSQNLIAMLFAQIYAEFLQLVRTPVYLIGILLFSCLVAFFPPDEQIGKLGLVFFAGISLLTFAIERLGKRVAVERVEGWLKLLRVTPLPPPVYLAAKIVLSLLILATSLFLVLSLGAWRIGIEQSLGQWLIMFFSLLLGVIPFAILGLALGYLVKPKSIDSIAGLSIPLALFTCGLPLPFPKFVQDLITYSPFYHYGQLALWSAGLENDNYIWLHLIWLVWTGLAFGFIAVWAYQRDQVTQL